MINYTRDEFGNRTLHVRQDVRQAAKRMDLEALDSCKDGRYLRTLSRQRGEMAKRMARLWGAL